MQITLSNGYIVNLRDTITFGQRRKMLAPMFDGIKIDALSGQVNTSELTGKYLFDMQDRAFDVVVMSFTKPDGTVITENLRQLVEEFSEEDGERIYNEVSRIAKLDNKQGMEKKS